MSIRQRLKNATKGPCKDCDVISAAMEIEQYAFEQELFIHARVDIHNLLKAGDKLKDEIKKLTSIDMNVQRSEYMNQYMRLLSAIREWEKVSE